MTMRICVYTVHSTSTELISYVTDPYLGHHTEFVWCLEQGPVSIHTY